MIRKRVLIVLHGLLLAIVLASMLALVLPSSIARADTVVNFPDPKLQQAIRDAIGKPTGDIYESDLGNLISLTAASKAISDLTGLEYCTSLTELSLSGNQISDIAPLSGLTSLTNLDLAFNHQWISDISPLSGLTRLTELNLCGNGIGNISPLSGLTSLTNLDLDFNQIRDLSPLSGLTRLTELGLSLNGLISDISPLSGLTSLTGLNLCENSIGNISPLSGLTNLTWLLLCENRISDVSPLANLTSLTGLNLFRNGISDISPLSGLTNLTNLVLLFNQISNVSPLVNNPGLAQGDTVDLRINPLDANSVNVYIPQLQGRGVQVFYDVPAASTPVTGITREVNGTVLPGVSITLDSTGPVVSDQSGQFQIMATTTGSHTLVAHKDGFRDRTQTINVAELGPGYAVTCNFQGQRGLIPNAPSMQYAMDCINRWLYPPSPDTGLDIWTALDVINAWLYPIQ